MKRSINPPGIDLAISLSHVFNDNPRLAIIGLRVETKLPAGLWKRVIDGNLFSDTELRALWREYGGKLNIGIACGTPSRIVVVDADNAAAVQWVLDNLPNTPMRVKTKKGMHFYYVLPEGVDQRNRTDILGSKKKWEHDAQAAGFDVRSHHYDDPDAQKEENDRVLGQMQAAWKSGLHVEAILDVRGTGGQVVGPGSKKDDGFEYTVTEPWTPELWARVPQWDPAWVHADLKWKRPVKAGAVSIAKLKAKESDEDHERRIEGFTDSEKIRRAAGWLKRTPGAIQGQRGHDHTFYVACRLANGWDIGTDAAFELMQVWNASCQPQWTIEELAHKVMDTVKHSGPENGKMLLTDTPEFLASKKVEPILKIVPGATMSVVSPLSANGAALPNPDKSGQPTTELLPMNDESARRVLNRLWGDLGVRFADIEAADAPIQIARIPNSKQQCIPAVLNNIVAVLNFSIVFRSRRFTFNDLKAISLDGDRVFDDAYSLALRSELDAMFGGRTQIAKELVYDAVTLAAQQRTVDPAASWLTGLPPWDGVDRIARIPADVLGADDTTTNRDQFRHFIVSLVARIIRPGTKVDTCLFLVGKQGRKKSQFFRLLMDGHRNGGQWFSDRHVEMDDKDSQMFIATHHLVEWSEAEHAKSAAKVNKVKAFLSQQDDVFRPPYGHSLVTRPRRCVFCATSNDDELIHDPTGARRFYVIRVGGRIDLSKLLTWRPQLFAQALSLYRGHVAAEARARGAHPDDDGAAEAAMPNDAAFNAGRWWFDEDEEGGRDDHLTSFRAVSPYEDKIRAWVEGRYRDREEHVAVMGYQDRATVGAFSVGEVVEEALGLRAGQSGNPIVTQIHAGLIAVGCVPPRGRAPTRIPGRAGTGRWWLLPEAMDAGGIPRGVDLSIYGDDDPPWSACDDIGP